LASSSGSSVTNNIWYNNRVDAAGVAGAPGKYNWFYGNRAKMSIDAQAASGTNDVVGASDPFVNAPGLDFRPARAIPGIPLASVFSIDAVGVLRGADGAWDRGAYEFVGP
jgi:hypothetical protein